MTQTPSSSPGKQSPLVYVLIALLLVGLWAAARFFDQRVSTRPPPPPDMPPGQTALPPPASSLDVSERTIIDIYRRASPAVVSVANTGLVRDFFGFHTYEIPQGMGTGFVWDKEGHIISNFHVVYGASSIGVTLSDGASYEATVTGVAPDHDIAVLHIEAPPETLSPVPLGVSSNLLVGQRVLAIGNPFGLDTSLSVGVVSALGRTITSMTDRKIYDMIQTDAAINPGNSGGPLLDSSGRLVGINTAIISPSGAYAGIGFAVPVDTVRRVVPNLITHGRVRRAGLGIQLLPERYSEDYDIRGAIILRAVPGGAARRAGLRGTRQTWGRKLILGDTITGIDGETVGANDDLLAILDRHQAGDSVVVTYRRQDTVHETTAVLQAVED